MDATLDNFYAADTWQENPAYFEGIPHLRQNKNVRALGLPEIIGGFTIFVASCFAKKVFDELYDRTLKRPIGEFLDRLFVKDSPVADKLLELRDVVYFEDIDTVVVVRATISQSDGRNIAPLLLEAHRIAHNHIEQHGRRAPVHCHSIKDGRIDIEPRLYISLEQLDRENDEPRP